MKQQARVRVEVVRSGGFAGLTRAAAMDTAELDAERAEQLRKLVDESGIRHGHLRARAHNAVITLL